MGDARDAPQPAVVRPHRWRSVDRDPTRNASGQGAVVSPIERRVDGGVKRSATVGEARHLLRHRTRRSWRGHRELGLGTEHQGVTSWRPDSLNDPRRADSGVDGPNPARLVRPERADVGARRGEHTNSRRENELAPSSNHWILERPATIAWVTRREWPGPRPRSLGIGKESNAWTRSDCVCSKTVHGAVLDFLTRTCPNANGRDTPIDPLLRRVDPTASRVLGLCVVGHRGLSVRRQRLALCGHGVRRGPRTSCGARCRRAGQRHAQCHQHRHSHSASNGTSAAVRSHAGRFPGPPGSARHSSQEVVVLVRRIFAVSGAPG